MSSNNVKVLFGTATPILANKPDPCSNDVPALLDLLEKHNIKYLDAAVIYGSSEETLGAVRAGDRGFIIDTKLPGGMAPESLKEKNIVKLGHESLKKLAIKKINTLYLHSSSTGCDTPIAETLSGINTLYQQGVFAYFGISNYTPEQVQETWDHCKEKGYILPTRFQGSYNAFGRHYEQTLIPILRRHHMSFFAYSPAAGGFLSKPPSTLFGEGGRFDRDSGKPTAGWYNDMYSDRPRMWQAHAKWHAIADEANIKPAGMALRWVKYHPALDASHDDALIIGGRTFEQAEESLRLLEQGPLPDEVARKINELWDFCKDEAITDVYHDYTNKDAKNVAALTSSVTLT